MNATNLVLSLDTDSNFKLNELKGKTELKGKVSLHVQSQRNNPDQFERKTMFFQGRYLVNKPGPAQVGAISKAQK